MNAEDTRPASAANNTGTVARNSFWYGLEMVISLVVTFVTSVAVARVVGPVRLSGYQLLVWMTNVTVAVGAFGVSSTTRKYMAECLNSGQPDVARATYLSTLKIQSWIALGALPIALVLMHWLGDPQELTVSLLLIAAMVPRLIATIPSQANNAAEVMRRNTGPSLAGGIVSTVLTIFSLYIGWDLVGVAAAVVVGSLLECGLKLYSVERWLGGVPRGTVSPELKKRMFAYSGQGLALMLLNVVVWDRSDMVILKALNNDKTQITFFSLAFNLAERILMIPNSFGYSLAATMMAQYGRGQTRLKEMTVDGARYAMLLALPMLLGVACISQPLVLLVYTEKYRPMITALTIVALLAIPKALVASPTMLLQATEKQGFLIWWGCLCGAVDIGLDFLLVRKYGANGAAIANGSAQAMAAIGIWIYVWKAFGLDLRLRDFGRILLSGAMMAAAVLAFTRTVPGYTGMFGAIATGGIVWIIALRVTGALKPEDVSRFLSVGGSLPAVVRPHWKRAIGWLAPGAAPA
jgi:O-antigen/teichoic acid export membrane protein